MLVHRCLLARRGSPAWALFRIGPLAFLLFIVLYQMVRNPQPSHGKPSVALPYSLDSDEKTILRPTRRDGRREGARRGAGDTNASHASNQSACVLAKLELRFPAIMKMAKKLPRVECSPEPNWVTLRKGRFVLSSSALAKHGEFSCDAIPILRVDDFHTKEDVAVHNIQNGTRIEHDFYRIQCRAADGSQYRNYQAGVREPLTPTLKDTGDRRKGSGNGLDLDVIMIGFDSTSHLAWMRHLPKTRDYFVRELMGTELEGYNILGDGTPAAIMPILLGKREEELPEARRGQPGATTVDGFPWVWNHFKKAGYAVSWNEDEPTIGTFHYRMLGFKQSPVPHYFRHFAVAFDPHLREFEPFCLGDRPRAMVMLDYMREVLETYPKHQRKFVFGFQSEMSHGDNNLLTKIDDDLLEYVKSLKEDGLLDRAMLVMMADHGARFSKVRATEQGKLEERLPYFGISFPKWFHNKYPDIVNNLKANAQRLTTPFDIHETLLDILNFTGSGPADITKRGVSLFKAIPSSRDCTSAQVDHHWCACLNWYSLDTANAVLQPIMRVVMDTFNKYTEEYRDRCAVLRLHSILSASVLKTTEAMLKFKDTNDGGRGRFGLMTDTTKHSSLVYQLTFSVDPSGGHFEVTVKHDLILDSYLLNEHDISRTNPYGDAPACLEGRVPHLRPFCFCTGRLA